MQRGHYSTHLRKIRNLYSHKLCESLDAIKKHAGTDGFITAENTQSGINLILKTDLCTVLEDADEYSEEELAEITREMTDSAAELGIKVRGIDQLSRDGQIYLIFYYNQIPLDEISKAVQEMTAGFRKLISDRL
jgi:DNA-binding transcriptional MocR family regulator